MAAMDTDEVSLPQALAAVQASFADAPGDAQAARQWAEGRGYDWGDSEQLLAQFLQGEARCETLRKAREHKKGEAQRAGVQARANALAAELGCTEPLDTADALAFCEKVVAEKGASNLTADAPSPPPAAELKKLEAIHDALRTDFALRRRMLLTRCDVTMQCFLWGDAADGRAPRRAPRVRRSPPAAPRRDRPEPGVDARAARPRGHGRGREGDAVGS